MTNTAPAWRHTACVLTLALAAGSTGCKSAGGSKWAWNPWSKPKLDAATALAGSAPKLPSDGATPLVEGSATAKPATAAIATTKTQTPPAIGGMAPAFDAVAKAVPTINKPAPEPNWKPYSTAAAPATTATAAATPKPPTTAVASAGGPYDPNGYKPSKPAAAAPTSRYGEDRYAAAPSSTPAFDPGAFADLPPVQAAKETTGRYGDRYAAATNQATQNASSAADRYATAAIEAVQGVSQDAAAADDRYASAATAKTQQATEAASSMIEKPAAALAQATSLPTPPAYPTTPAVSAPTPSVASYPIASASAGGGSAVAKSTVGTLPPSTSSYAKTTPITPIEPATANEPTGGAPGSVVRLTTLPGEYRPGGTSTYPSTSTSGAVKRY